MSTEFKGPTVLAVARLVEAAKTTVFRALKDGELEGKSPGHAGHNEWHIDERSALELAISKLGEAFPYSIDDIAQARVALAEEGSARRAVRAPRVLASWASDTWQRLRLRRSARRDIAVRLFRDAYDALGVMFVENPSEKNIVHELHANPLYAFLLLSLAHPASEVLRQIEVLSEYLDTSTSAHLNIRCPAASE